MTTATASNWKSITLETSTVLVEVDWDAFRIVDKADMHQNGTVAIMPRTGAKRACQRMRKWAASTSSGDLAGLSFWKVRDLLQTAGIATHTFCSID